MDNNSAEQARAGLAGGIKGTVKEAFGARTEVNTAAASTEQLIVGEATAQKRAAEKAAHQQAVTESARAERAAERAVASADAKAEAARLRREADDLTNNADLP
ncbi:hypothetical protein [Mycolicibacterium sarraceniae]|uniref:CsbD family protein n=1 Tax=Mycolicibacterium sarraceniae TaxID=1534348 RepID=A0A7I7SQY3_9MYCO|nr:hypothetical protein [Mycolicibacterium sarraceniae]BBY58801.1 hypothetical protein MSAR_19370 [Mycolicibacterium sarraceniae]